MSFAIKVIKLNYLAGNGISFRYYHPPVNIHHLSGRKTATQGVSSSTVFHRSLRQTSQ